MTAVGRASSRGAGVPRADRAARIGALGLGWIGRHRIAALANSDAASVLAVADPDEHARAQAARELPGARIVDDLNALLELDLDGIVIATPSALHADQAIAALRHGVAVFCEKPLGRGAAETTEVVRAARAADRLLGVDLSYRHTRAARALREAVQGGELGRVYAAELTFHNAYGPDKPWFTQRRLSGGGCLIDLGTHLVDLALWITGAGGGDVVAATVRRGGGALETGGDEVEDFALAELDLDVGATVRLGCSWFLHAGCDCVFDATFYGTEGAARMRNVDGSFYDFAADRLDGTTRRRLVSPGDDWGAGAITAWARELAAGAGFRPGPATDAERIARVIDRIYEAAR